MRDDQDQSVREYWTAITAAISGAGWIRPAAITIACLIVITAGFPAALFGPGGSLQGVQNAAADHTWSFTGNSWNANTGSNDYATGIAEFDGNFWTTYGGTAYRYDKTWTKVGTVSLPSTAASQDIHKTSSGNILVADNNDDNIEVLDSNFNHVKSVDVSAQTTTPVGITEGPNGKYYLAGLDTNIYVYNSDWTYDRAISLSSQTTDIHGVELSPGGSWWVLDSTSAQVYKYDSSWSYTGANYDVGSEDPTPQNFMQATNSNGNWYYLGQDTPSSTGDIYEYGGHAGNPVEGYIKDNDGNGISGASATLKDSGGTTIASTTTNASGGYSFDAITDGTYYVHAEADGFYDKNSDEFSVSGSPVTVPDINMRSTSGEPPNDKPWVFRLEDESGRFAPSDSELIAWEMDQGDNIAGGIQSRAEFNHQNETNLNLVEGEQYSLEVVNQKTGDRYEITGYSANKSGKYETYVISIACSTCDIEEPTNPTATPIADGGTTTNSGDYGGTAGNDWWWIDDGDGDASDGPYISEPSWPSGGMDGNTSTGGDSCLEIEYYDPMYETTSFDYSVEADNGTVFEGTKTFTDPIGYYRGCVDGEILQLDQQENTSLNWSATDGDGNTVNGSTNSFSSSPPPTFGPTGSSPDTTGERLWLLLFLIGGIAALWFGGQRYAPAENYSWWPVSGVSPLAAIGIPILTIVVLDISGGGVISAALAFAASRIGPLVGIVGFGLVAYYIYRNYVLAPPS